MDLADPLGGAPQIRGNFIKVITMLRSLLC